MKHKISLKQLYMFILISLFLSVLINITPAHATDYDWSKPRPSQHRSFNDIFGSATTDGECAVGLAVEVFQYSESSSPNDNDYLRFRVDASANTRRGVECSFYYPIHGFQWLNVSNPSGITGDNAGVWLDLGFPLLFYGVEYSRIWVCSNGFISLISESNEPSPQPIPSNNTPNAIIAPFWRDLKPNLGGSITYGEQIFNGHDGHYYFVVSWNNVRDASDNPQTFQVLIERRYGFGSDRFHNRIFFQYQTITKNTTTSIGVENQLGLQGYSVNLNDMEVRNGGCFGIFPGNQGSRLVALKIKLTKSDNQAMLDPLLNYISGYNVEIFNETHHYADLWGPAIDFGADLLIDGVVWLADIGTGAGIVIGGLFVLVQMAANEASTHYSEATKNYDTAGQNDNEAFIQAFCEAEELGGGQGPLGEPFDASLAGTFEWSFTDQNNTAAHDLTITAEAYYINLDSQECTTVTTSATLNMYTGYHYLDINGRLEIPGGGQATSVAVNVSGENYATPVSLILPQGSYEVECEEVIYRDSKKYVFDGWYPTSDPENPCTVMLSGDINLTAEYEEYLQLAISVMSAPSGGGTTNPLPSTYEYPMGMQVSVNATANPGFSFSRWTLDGVNHYGTSITVTMNMNHILIAYFGPSGGGNPEPCPYLFAWNGSNYLSYGIIDIHNSSGQDVTREVPITKKDVSITNHKARFMLVEGWVGLNFSESVIDQVKLYAIDAYGRRLLCPLINATHSTQGNVLLPLLFSDNWKTQMLLLETIDLTFLMPYPQSWIQNYTFAIEGCNKFKL